MRRLDPLLRWRALPYVARQREGQLTAGRSDLPAPYDAPAATPTPGPQPLSLTRNFLWTLLGNGVYMGCQWGMLVALAKLGTPDMVGQFALGLAVTAPVFLLTNLQLRAVQVTDVGGSYAFGHYLGLRVLTTAAAIAITIALALTGGYPDGTASIVIALGVAKAIESVSDMFGGLSQLRERMDLIAKSLLIKGPASLAAFVVTTWLTRSVLWGVLALAAVWMAVLIAYDAAAIRPRADAGSGPAPVMPRWERAPMSALAWLALPLGVTMALTSLGTNIPRYVIQHSMGERALGIFAALAYTMTAGTAVVGALGQSASSRLARHFAHGEIAEFRALVGKLVACGVALGAACVLVAVTAGSRVLRLLYTPEYAEHGDLFVLLTCAAAVGYVASFLGYAVTAARCFRAQSPLFAIVGAWTALACSWLIPRYGLSGAGWALVSSAVLQLCGSLVLVARATRRAVEGG